MSDLPTLAEPDQENIRLVLGNGAPIHHYPEGPRKADHLGTSTTVVSLHANHSSPEWVRLTLSTDNDLILRDIKSTLPDDYKDCAPAIREMADFWPRHSGNSKPDWVACTDKHMGEAIGVYYGCPVQVWVDGMIPGPTMLLTNVGRDAIHAQILTTGTQPAAAKYVALTASTTAPATTDTTLAGEITTVSGGLIRAACTYAHTTGTNTSTLTNTFTANGSDTLPVTIAQIGVLNASSAGTLFFHTALSGTATLSVVGDNITVTETMTAG